MRLHTSCEYRVSWRSGSCRGSPTWGRCRRRCAACRAWRVRARAWSAGGVGLTGDQTGVYPLERPGGWPLIGRTDQVMADLAAGYFRLAVGDRVRFTLFA